MDVQEAPLPDNAPPLSLPPAPSPLYPNPADVRRLVDALESAKRPLILAGRGAVIAARSRRSRARRTQWGAAGNDRVRTRIVRDDPWSVGISGGFRRRRG